MIVKKFNENIDVDIEKIKDLIRLIWSESLDINGFSDKYFSGSRGYLLTFFLNKDINNKTYNDYMEFLETIKKTEFSVKNYEGDTHNFGVTIFVNKKFSDELTVLYNAKKYNL